MKKQFKATRSRFSPLTMVMLAVLVLYTLSMFTILGWAFLSSFKDDQLDFRINVLGLPKVWVWNYTYVFNMFVVKVQTATGTAEIGMGQQFINTILYSVGCSFTHTLTPFLMAYICAKFRYKFSSWIHTTVIVTMILPIIGATPSEIAIAKALNFYDNIWGLWLMKANFLGSGFLIAYSMFKGIPYEFTEAAKIDGAGNVAILLRIMMPLAKNTFFTMMLLGFIGFWNDYSVPLLYLPSYPTVALGMYKMATTTDNSLASVPMRMTGAMLLLIPILILFVIFQKRLLGNLSMGGLKG